MNCETVDRQLNDYVDGQLGRGQQSGIGAHLKSCADCRFTLQVHREYLEVMRNLPAPEPVPGRLANMLRQARQRGDNTEQRGGTRAGFLRGFATAAVLAALVISGQWQYLLQSAAVTPSAPIIAEHALTRNVAVIINVPADMVAANLTLDFPDALRMQGLEDLRRVGWNVDLAAGSNLLTLPVTIAAGTNLAQSLSISARVAYDNREKGFDLPVTLVAAGSSLSGEQFTGATLPSYQM